jgi:hypothetical protein
MVSVTLWINSNSDMPVFDDLKRGRFGDALKNIAVEKARIIRLLLALLAE